MVVSIIRLGAKNATLAIFRHDSSSYFTLSCVACLLLVLHKKVTLFLFEAKSISREIVDPRTLNALFPLLTKKEDKMSRLCPSPSSLMSPSKKRILSSLLPLFVLSVSPFDLLVMSSHSFIQSVYFCLSLSLSLSFPCEATKSTVNLFP